MGWVSGIVVYILVWWTLLFCVLPWGNRPDEVKHPANAGSAPANPRLLKKFMITTVLSFVVWVVIYLLIRNNAVDFYSMAHEQVIKDHWE